ncbi:hypothetical protein NSE01_20820 [Novosphingobium sediminis]|uniref:DUF4136 domain-containing protein n=1 Tax=Novosphingobium sediminis TaxID=707214 RepID=A0A512AKK8_9SPHN|nr:DUF4136 domain-containing protein [Novosphingobium sediminis]GEO00250.1 hypothetical protein NSE01_20820 [Novosphingobium sediminis]
MKARLLLAAFALAASPALAAPVEVTRFHTPDSITTLGRSAVAVIAAPGTDPSSLETRVWLQAVEAELAALRFGTATPGAADAVAEVRVEREVQRTERQRGPVSVGVGGSTGGWNSGVGLGVGFNLGGGPKARVYTRLVVTIRSRATGLSLWEGRAENVERQKAKEAAVDQAALRIAHALFSGFPRTSGATITVK